MPIWCQGPIIPIDIAEEDDTLERDDDVASSSEEEVMSDDSGVVESDSDEDYVYLISSSRYVYFMFYGSANAFHILVEQGLCHRFTTISAVTTIRF